LHAPTGLEACVPSVWSHARHRCRREDRVRSWWKQPRLSDPVNHRDLQRSFACEVGDGGTGVRRSTTASSCARGPWAESMVSSSHRTPERRTQLTISSPTGSCLIRWSPPSSNPPGLVLAPSWTPSRTSTLSIIALFAASACSVNHPHRAMVSAGRAESAHDVRSTVTFLT
jgi:hypothetical protein